LGPLVHNDKVNQKLEKIGIRFIDSVDKVKEGTVIIAAHGARPEIFEKVKKKKLDIVDTTCPLVKKVQNIARELLEKNYQILILGDKGHTEVEGILGAIDNKAVVIESVDDISNLKLDQNKHIALIVQTTQERRKTEEILKVLQKRFKRVEFFDTICPTVGLYQKELKKLAEKVDLILIIGSKTSANTTRLKEIAENKKKPIYQVEEPEDLEKDWFSGIGKVGIASGTSTPIWQIRKIIKKLKSYDQKKKDKSN
jgi:4-hydroxy-3-methylbut-2-enyl diphosphate reductase